DMENNKICLICSVPIDFYRFGILACKACAAFFKRTIISGKTYSCRKGDGQCVFRKHEKFMCRSCRYDKCVEFGMEYAIRKDENGENDEKEEDTSSSNETLLDRIQNAYRKSYDRRMEHESKVVKEHRLKKLEHPSRDVYISNMSSFNDILPVLVREMVTIFEQVFPFLENLILEDKATLFQNCLGKFSMIEGFCLTHKYIETNNFMTSLMTCIDCENIDKWIRDEDNVERKADFRT
ncbi:hypothetical protein PFISCL1PPCAC_14293, partial [Pristionchus fissidentatus]